MTIRTFIRGGALLAAALSLAAAAAVQAQNANAPAAAGGTAFDGEHGSPESGQRLFMAVGCWECHGMAGQGGNGTGPQLGPDPLPFPAFIQQLRHPAEDMPPYGKAILSIEQAADIRAYLAAQTKVTAKDVPMLRN